MLLSFFPSSSQRGGGGGVTIVPFWKLSNTLSYWKRPCYHHHKDLWHGFHFSSQVLEQKLNSLKNKQIHREELEKQKAHERYMRLQEQGKTEQARKDLGTSKYQNIFIILFRTLKSYVVNSDIKSFCDNFRAPSFDKATESWSCQEARRRESWYLFCSPFFLKLFYLTCTWYFFCSPSFFLIIVYLTCTCMMYFFLQYWLCYCWHFPQKRNFASTLCPILKKKLRKFLLLFVYISDLKLLYPYVLSIIQLFIYLIVFPCL